MAIDRADIQNIYPLTPLQQGMYFHAQSEPWSDAYFEQWSLRVAGDLRPELVREAWNELFARHEVFRSVFTPGDGTRPLQIVLRQREVELATKDLSDVPAAEQEERLAAERAADRRRGFQLGSEPLVRVLVLRLSRDQWEIVWSHHHIVLDGWSVGLVQAEFLRIYAARRAGRDAALDKAPPFSQFVKSLPAAPDVEFWRSYLAGYETVVDLPRAEHPRPSEIARERVVVSPDTSSRVDAFCRREGVTLSAFVQAVWGIILARYAYADEVVFGYVMSGRQASLPDVERMVGLLINTIPVRVRLRENETFRDLVRRLQASAGDLAAHQQTPLVDIQRASGSGAPLFNHVVALENHPVADTPGAADGLGFEITAATSYDRTHYGFDLVVIPGADTLTFRLSWDRASYDDDMMARIAAQLSHVIRCVIDEPDVIACRLNILPPDQWDAVVHVPNRSTAGYPVDATIVDLFDAQVRRHPDAPALLAPHRSTTWLTYGELDAKATAVAAHLQHDLRVSPGSRIAVYLRPSEASIVSVLGILKAGCTYVPVDPRYPMERVRFILEDSRAQAILTSADDRHGLAAAVWPLVDVESLPHPGTRTVSSSAGPDDVAYVIYTSGSTGTPKGCEVTHRNVVRLVVNDRFDFDFGPSDVWVMAHSLSFDFSVWEIYGAVLRGGRLVIPSRETVQDVPAFRDLLARHRVTVLNQTPLAFYNLIEIEDAAADHSLGEHLRYVIFGGDRLDVGALRRWTAHYPAQSIALVNMYGITETTVHVTYCRLTADVIAAPRGRSPIGRPLPETTVYVCDRHRNPQPIGARGEMLVGGTGVCRGYLDRPDLTAERFVPDVFTGSGRLYRSGDLAYRDSSGALNYIGRNDQQVKIRGHRIEPAEVQRALVAIDGITQAAVVVEQGAAGSELVACVSGTVDAEAVRAGLALRLPDYAVPGTIVVAESLPLTAHGKIDAAAVRALRTAAAGPRFEAPATERERTLAAVWTDVLNVERVGRHDRFISLGGDSIKSIQILARLRARGLTLNLKDVFQYPTVAALAPRLRERSAPAAAVDSEAPFGLTAIQRRFFVEHPIDSAHFNQAILLRCQQRIDPERLRDALQTLHDTHGALRLRFSQGTDGVWQQRIAARGDIIPLAVADLAGERDPAAAMYRLSASEQTGMNLGDGPLFRAALYHLPDADRLLLVAHHLVVDGVTWRFVLEDLTATLTDAAAPDATDPLSAWAQTQSDEATHRRFGVDLPFWLETDRAPDGSTDRRLVEAGQYADAVEELLTWSAADTADLLRRACEAYQTNVGELVLTGVARALGRWTGGDRLQIALEGHGRDALPGCDVSRTAGWFTALYPFVLDLEDRPVGRRIRQLKEDLRRIPGGGAGYGVLRYLSEDPAAAALRARPRVCFNYLGELGLGPSGLFAACADPIGPSANPNGPRPFALDIGAIVVDGRLRLALTFAGRHVDHTSRRNLLQAVDEELRVVVAHCLGRRAPELTPADLTHKSLTLDELDGLFNDD